MAHRPDSRRDRGNRFGVTTKEPRTVCQQLEQDTDLVIQRADIAALKALALAAALRNPPKPNTVQLVVSK